MPLVPTADEVDDAVARFLRATSGPGGGASRGNRRLRWALAEARAPWQRFPAPDSALEPPASAASGPAAPPPPRPGTGGDTGSPAVQIAQWTARLRALDDHLSSAPGRADAKAKHARGRLLARRHRMLRYLRRTDYETHFRVCDALGLQEAASGPLPHGQRSRFRLDAVLGREDARRALGAIDAARASELGREEAARAKAAREAEAMEGAAREGAAARG